jgi:hypothetical protein
MKPTVSKIRKTIIDQNPKTPIFSKETAQGKRKAISKSKIIKRIATK